MLRITIFNEYLHEKQEESIRAVYPQGIHGALANVFGDTEQYTVRTVTLEDPECGLTREVLDDTDVLLWWGHIGHDQVPDAVAQRVQEAVLRGMGAIFLHSAHFSKPFRLLMGTSCSLTWREEGDRERLWVVNPGHPIAQGIDRYFDLPHEETYGEAFDIPEPEEQVFIGWYEGGEVFRSGCCWHRGRGKVFYFQPGHEAYPTYYDSRVGRVLRQAAAWAAPVSRTAAIVCPQVEKPTPKFDEK